MPLPPGFEFLDNMAGKAKGALAKQLAKGAMQRLSHDWTIEWFREQAAVDGDFADLLQLAPAWEEHLYTLLNDDPRLRQTTLFEVIGWIEEKRGNPALTDALAEDHQVMNWLARAWKEFLTGEPEGVSDTTL